MTEIQFTKCKCCVIPGEFDIENIPLDCDATWKLISSGHTVGIFQIETKLGQDWARKVKPDNIEGLAALVSLLRPGPLECIGKNTLVLRRKCENRDKTKRFYQRCTIEQLYHDFIAFKKHPSNNNKRLSIISLDENKHELFKNYIKNVVYKGRDKIFRIYLKTRYSTYDKLYKYGRCSYFIEATQNHKFLTSRGWKKLRDIDPGDYVATINKHCGKMGQRNYKQIKGYRNFQDIAFYNYEYKCVFCDWDDASLDVNHLSGNRRTNNNPENLVWLCPNHHRMYTEGIISREEVIKAREKYKLHFDKDCKYSRVMKIECVGEEDLYDISVDGPFNNYIAGDFVVHNSGMSQQYVDVKSGKKKMEFLHPCLESILEPTYGIMCYQEQSLKIAVEVAGFSPENADTLRKAIGKKLPKLMAELKQKFIAGAKKKGLVTPEIAEEIFSWIEKCQRYQFNKSHAVSYAMVGYKTAWMKCHFPHEFFTSWLTYSHYKTNPKEEIYGLVQDARLFNVPILSPDIRRCNIHFKIVETPAKSVAFGLAHIRSVGQSAIKKIVESASGSLDTWYDFLTSVPNFHRNVGIALIKAGACDCYGLSRSQMIHELEVILGATIISDEGNKKEIKGLTKRELEWLFEHCSDTKNMADTLSEMSHESQEKPLRLSQMKKPQLVGLGCSLSETMPEKAPDEISKLTKPKLIDLIIGYGYQDTSSKIISITEKRRAILAEKAVLIDKKLEDTNTSKAMAERHFLGIALSCSPADDAETDLATHTCLDVARAFNEESITVCAIIDRVTHTKTKRGKNPGQSMCFLTISDSTYSTDAVVFPKAYEKNKIFCHTDSIVLVYGKKQNRSFIVSEIQKLI